MALHVGLRWAERLAGIVALSTYLTLPEKLGAEASEAQHGLPVFQAHGSVDPVVTPDRGQQTRDRLVADGYSVEWHSYPIQHSVSQPEIADIGHWLQTCFSTSADAPA